MSVYDTPYYGQRQKALTGMGYGPYYGMSLTGGGALPDEGRRALSPEISDKYGATGTPAITEGAEGAAQPAFEGVAFAEDPQASWGQVAYAAGLPGGKAYPGTVQPKGLTKTALGIAPTVASRITGVPGIAFTQAVRNFINPLLSKAFPSLFTSSVPDMSQQEAMDILGMPELSPPVDLETGMVGIGESAGTPGPSPEGFGPEGTSEGMGAPGTGIGGSATGGAPW